MWTKKKSIYVYEGCTNYALHGGGGVCIRHGHGLSITIHTMNLLHLNPNSKDYRFSNPPNLRSARAAIRGQEGRSVPGVVTILCREIVEVSRAKVLILCLMKLVGKGHTDNENIPEIIKKKVQIELSMRACSLTDSASCVMKIHHTT